MPIEMHSREIIWNSTIYLGLSKWQLVISFFWDHLVQISTAFCFLSPVICFQNWLFFWSIFWAIFEPFLWPSHRAYSIFQHANHGLYRVFRVSISDAFWSNFWVQFWMPNPHYKLAILGVENWRPKNCSKKTPKVAQKWLKMGAQKTAKKRRKMDQEKWNNKSILSHARLIQSFYHRRYMRKVSAVCRSI